MPTDFIEWEGETSRQNRFDGSNSGCLKIYEGIANDWS